MFTIPAIYKNNNEDYITIPAIKKFIKSISNSNIKISQSREELMEEIIHYGSLSKTNEEQVLTWIDTVITEGIKDIHLQHLELTYQMNLAFSTDEKINSYLHSKLNKNISIHICNNRYNVDFILINAELITTTLGSKIEMTYCKKLHIYDKKTLRTKEIDFPIVAEYYLDTSWLMIRAKPRSSLYIYNPDGFNIDNSQPTTTEKQIKEVIDLVLKFFDFEKPNKGYATPILKNKLFLLLDKYSCTPKEIEDLMNIKSENIKNISRSIIDICTVPDNMYQDVDADIKNIVEKYLSINWSDKQIFIKDRNAYPVKLSATDEEESKVEQSAALEEPLQTKALFFDNKKMLYKSRSCDGVVFQYKRSESTYFPKDTFAVRISVNNKDTCIFKFMEYTSKEDIENVVFSIIRI